MFTDLLHAKRSLSQSKDLDHPTQDLPITRPGAIDLLVVGIFSFFSVVGTADTDTAPGITSATNWRRQMQPPDCIDPSSAAE